VSVPVTFVSSHARVGGAERYLEILLEGLDASWIQTIVCLEHGPLAEQLRARGYRTEVIHTGARAASLIRAAWMLRRLLRRRPTRVLHANGVKAAVVSVMAAVGTGVSVIWVKHDFSRDGLIARVVASRCSRIVGVSASVLSTFDGNRRPNLHVVHNGLPTTRVDRRLARRVLLDALGPPPANRIVGLVGRLDPIKGHRELLAILPELLEHVPGLRLAFIGGEDPSHLAHAEALRAEVRRSRTAPAVAFLGERADALQLIGGCDVLVIPSLRPPGRLGSEGFGYAGLEALVAGTPVVAYADGGLPELLGDSGVLVPPGNRDALRTAILRVLREDDLRNRLASCGRTRAETLFAPQRMIAAMEAHYRGAAGMDVEGCTNEQP
jgi:glycosyltransferase involved in cell wall biosynthesis